MNGYKSINEIDFSVEKWNLYSKYYTFRMYTRILSGRVSRSGEFEKYLRTILEEKMIELQNGLKDITRNKGDF